MHHQDIDRQNLLPHRIGDLENLPSRKSRPQLLPHRIGDLEI